MEHKRKRRMMSAVLALLLSAVVLGGCGGSGNDKVPPASGNVFSAATPTGLKICVTCHTEVMDDWLTSKHANLDPDGSLSSAGVPTIGQVSSCTNNCHDRNGDSNNLTAGFTGAAGVTRPVTGCESCHGPGSLHAGTGGSGPISLLSGTFVATPVGSGQLAMCTSCHELLDTAGTGTATAVHDPASVVSPTGNQYVITDTHFATPASFTGALSANVNDIGGYAMDFSNIRVCTNCHNPHTSANVNREWAQSKHADRTALGAWAHYNWSESSRRACERCHTTTGVSTYADALQSGNSTLAEQVRSGSLTMITSTAGWKPEMLECNGCHVNSRGTLRNPSAYTATYNYSVAGASAVASFSYPDASKSNICIICHSARASGDSVKNLVFSAPTTTNFTNISFVDSHYLTAAGTMYKATGYAFPRSYTNPATYKHDLIGTVDAQNTGSAGPCVGCHMHRTGMSANHLYQAVGKDANGEVTSIVSEVCYQCHANSSSALALMVNTERVEYEEAIAALINQLDKKGISFYPNYPYMFQQRTQTGTVSATTGSSLITGTGGMLWSTGTPSVLTTDLFRVEVDGTAYGIASVDSDTQITLTSNYTGPTIANGSYVIMKSTRTDGVKNWLFGGSQEDGRNNMGAAFNLQVLEHEPGAYVHNSKYVKRLIYDSIDWVDDGALNYSVGATLEALPAGTSYKDEAMTYLLPQGVLWQGTYPNGYGVDSERP